MQASLTVSTSSCSPTTPGCFKSTQRQLTVMLVTICCAAVCLQLPYTALYWLNADKWSLWPDEKTFQAKIYFCKKVTDVIATSNYAVNFVLYCASGSAFRRGVQTMCRRSFRRRAQDIVRQSGSVRYHRSAAAAPMSMTRLSPSNTNRLLVPTINSRKTSSEVSDDNSAE